MNKAQELANKYNCAVATQETLDNEPILEKDGKQFVYSGIKYSNYTKEYEIPDVLTIGTIYTGSIYDEDSNVTEEDVKLIRLENNYYVHMYEDAEITEPENTTEDRLTDEEQNARKNRRTILLIIVALITISIVVYYWYKHHK